ncbi:MAG: ubiquinone biosynthesis protein UbiA [Halobacteriales archaeon]
MAVARHGSGPGATLRALASQVHPVFMLPPLAAAAFGSVLAGRVDPVAGGLHLTAIFLAVYTAHVKDGYVDFHRRGEDDDHPLTIRGCRLALLGATAAFGLCLVGLFQRASPLAVALTAPTWAIGYLHAPYLDLRPTTATVGYPAGIALALLGGVAVHGGRPGPVSAGYAAILLVLLAGVKVVDDAADLTVDRTMDKRTVAVVLGHHRARRLAYGLMAVAVLGTAGLAAAGVFPPASVAAAAAFATVAATAWGARPELATMLLVRGSYVFFAVLVAAVWFRPLG